MQVGSIKRGTMNITMRLPNETARQLDELCQAYNCKRSEFVIAQIQAQYDKLQGSPVFKQMLDSMNALTAKLKEQAQAIANENESSQTNVKG